MNILKPILLIYKSKTGFTKKYVDWITEKISCHTVAFSEINKVDIGRYETIIYGAGIHAGHIDGLEALKNKVLKFDDKNLIIFATGGAPITEDIVSKIKANNFKMNELENIGFYYFQSGLSYEKMGLLDKTIIKIYNKMLNLKNKKTAIEEGTSKTISLSYDHSKIEYIQPMIDYIKHQENI